MLEKQRQLNTWKAQFDRDSKTQISGFIADLKSQLSSNVAAFVEDHFEDKDAGKCWAAYLRDKHIEKSCQELSDQFAEQCNDEIEEISTELVRELKFSNKTILAKSIFMHPIIDGKRIWNWGTKILAGGLALAATIGSFMSTGFLATISGPLGLASLVVFAAGKLAKFFKSRDEKEHQARIKMEHELRDDIESFCEKLKEQMNGYVHQLSAHIQKINNQIKRIDSVVFQLADTQKT